MNKIKTALVSMTLLVGGHAFAQDVMKKEVAPMAQEAVAKEVAVKAAPPAHSTTKHQAKKPRQKHKATHKHSMATDAMGEK